MECEQRQWTILIYAGGNNDLAPEMAAAFNRAQNAPDDKQVAVITQIALAEDKIVSILRPYEQHKSTTDWPSSGRYLVKHGKSDFLEPLANRNMADPKSLQGFVEWGVSNFPAKRYMLILGGHGYQFVGCITDYSATLPAIMGYVEMSQAIEHACKNTGTRIDILMLDTCYANFIETLYEFGKFQCEPVKYLLTNIINGPLEGYDYQLLIQTVQQMKFESDMALVMARLIEQTQYDLCAYRVSHQKLCTIKTLFDRLSEEYMNSSLAKQVSLPQLFIIHEADSPFHDVVAELKKLSGELIVFRSSNTKHTQLLLNVANDPATIQTVCKQYQQLSFAKDNQWTKLLVPLTYQTDEQVRPFKPVVLPPQAIYAFISIMNTTTTVVERKKIFNDLATYKGWRIKI